MAVCYFEEENDWWVSKHLKKPIRSTITTVSWHPNSVLLATGSTDAHARVLSAFIKGTDERPEPSAWGERLPFNTVCGEYLNNSAGWVHGCAFSPSGNALAFTAHDSSVTVVYPSAPEQPPLAVISISTQLLPFMSLIWNGESEIIAAGYVSVWRLSLETPLTAIGLRSISISGERARMADCGFDGIQRTTRVGWSSGGVCTEHVQANGPEGKGQR